VARYRLATKDSKLGRNRPTDNKNSPWLCRSQERPIAALATLLTAKPVDSAAIKPAKLWES
jgi:hypothetical protein